MHRTIIYCLLFVASLLALTLSEFDPYADNSGTTVGLAGKDYCIIAADTRLSDSYMIRSRNQTKIFNVRLLYAIYNIRRYSYSNILIFNNLTFRMFLDWKCLPIRIRLLVGYQRTFQGTKT